MQILKCCCLCYMVHYTHTACMQKYTHATICMLAKARSSTLVYFKLTSLASGEENRKYVLIIFNN